MPDRRRYCGAHIATRSVPSHSNRDGLKVAVIGNDMSDVSVDAQPMKNGNVSLSRFDERFVQMQN